MVQEHHLGHVYLRWIFLTAMEGLAYIYIYLFCAAELIGSKTMLYERSRKMEAWWVVTLTEVSPFLLLTAFEWQRGTWDTPGAQHFGFHWMDHWQLLFCAVMLMGWDPPEGDGENFPVITKASLPPSGAVAVCWDLTLEHHWCGQFAQLLNQWELKQQRAEWQGSSWCQNWSHKITSQRNKEGSHPSFVRILYRYQLWQGLLF